MAQNGALPDLPESVSKPPEGVVLPPKDIRTIIEKTAGYVARNGPVFEGRIRDKEQSNPKFSFLSGNDAYAPFYQWRLDEVRAGRGTAISAGTTGDAAPVKQKAKGPEPPPEFQFSARMPNISALDLEVVRLTALHAARKGKSWTTALSQREARNFQFDFLRPQHSLYNFFSRLVDQYTLLLQTGPDGQKAEQARIRELQSNLQDRFRVMNLAKKRSEFVKYQESQKQRKEEEAEAERIAYAQIDWHDFVVVETVLFTEADDQVDLPPPTSLNDLQSASLEQKAMMSLARPDMRIEEAMPTDDMNGYAYGYTNGYDTNGYAAAPPPPQSYPTTYFSRADTTTDAIRTDIASNRSPSTTRPTSSTFFCLPPLPPRHSVPSPSTIYHPSTCPFTTTTLYSLRPSKTECPLRLHPPRRPANANRAPYRHLPELRAIHSRRRAGPALEDRVARSALERTASEITVEVLHHKPRPRRCRCRGELEAAEGQKGGWQCVGE